MGAEYKSKSQVLQEKWGAEKSLEVLDRMLDYAQRAHEIDVIHDENVVEMIDAFREQIDLARTI